MKDLFLLKVFCLKTKGQNAIIILYEIFSDELIW